LVPCDPYAEFSVQSHPYSMHVSPGLRHSSRLYMLLHHPLKITQIKLDCLRATRTFSIKWHNSVSPYLHKEE
jgi:hypothetical protein